MPIKDKWIKVVPTTLEEEFKDIDTEDFERFAEAQMNLFKDDKKLNIDIDEDSVFRNFDRYVVSKNEQGKIDSINITGVSFADSMKIKNFKVELYNDLDKIDEFIMQGTDKNSISYYINELCDEGELPNFNIVKVANT